MHIKLNEEPRKFTPLKGFWLKDMGQISLGNDEQVTFKTKSGKRNDLIQKDWGFYLCNSVNYNLKNQGFKTALVVSSFGGNKRLFVNLVEKEKMRSFLKYVKRNKSEIICWLDEWF